MGVLLLWAVCYSTESLLCNAKLAKSYYGVLMYLHGIKGFLHWGFNFYNSQYSISHIDPLF